MNFLTLWLSSASASSSHSHLNLDQLIAIASITVTIAMAGAAWAGRRLKKRQDIEDADRAEVKRVADERANAAAKRDLLMDEVLFGVKDASGEIIKASLAETVSASQESNSREHAEVITQLSDLRTEVRGGLDRNGRMIAAVSAAQTSFITESNAARAIVNKRLDDAGIAGADLPPMSATALPIDTQESS